jgi:hypothetical protein
MSFGPELPAGVVALWEAVDIWLEEREMAPVKTPAQLVSKLNEQMPEGFRVKKCVFPAEGALALGKECRAAHYRVWPRSFCSAERLAAQAKNYFGEDALLVEAIVGEKGADGEPHPWVSLVLANPAKNGVGGWVKKLVAEGLVAGWQDLCFARTALGHWNGVQVEPLTEEGAECLRIEK